MALYTKQFMIEVAKEGVKAKTYKEVALKFGVSSDAVKKWTELYAEYGELGFEPGGKEKSKDMEIRELKKELAQLKEENEMLKKVTAYFSKGSL